MPELISVKEFLQETWEDYNSPTTSTFVTKMSSCRNSVTALEETLEFDRSGLTKMKKAVKAVYNSGNLHVGNESYLSENLEKFGENALSREQEPDIGAAFLKFSVVTKELSALMKNMMQNLHNIVMFPLDSFVKGDLKGMKGDMKKPFDKAWKEYDNKFHKIEKDKIKLAEMAGLHKTSVSPAEVVEDMEKERRVFQLQMCEYLIKVNDVKTKKGVDLLQHLVEFYQAQKNYFQDGMKTIEHFNSYVNSVVGTLSTIKQQQDNEKRQLCELREALKSSVSTFKELPQRSESLSRPTSVCMSFNVEDIQKANIKGSEKTGYLLKKSEGKLKKMWQKRRCTIKEGCMSISHSDESKDPVRLNLLTCQAKCVPDDPTKRCFDVISSSQKRTYHFQTEDEQDLIQWISILNNAKEQVLMKAFGDAPGSSRINQSVRELRQTILQEVRKLPGNHLCCDCGAEDPEWLSVNFGICICLECCGVHRELGVHISRTQSLVIDDMGTSQLLIARTMSNEGFNDIMEATIDTKYKPTSDATREERNNFIRAKYEKRRYAIVTCIDHEDLKQDLKQAILYRDILGLLQVYGEGLNLMEPLPDTEEGETGLHLAIKQETGSSLYIADFIIQNSKSKNLETATKSGETALHWCARFNQTECMKLLLRTRPSMALIEDKEGKTAQHLAMELGNQMCCDLLQHAIDGKTELFENVNTDWGLGTSVSQRRRGTVDWLIELTRHIGYWPLQDDQMYDPVDYSDDELDERTPDKKSRSRPGSLVAGAIVAEHQRLSSGDYVVLKDGTIGRDRGQSDKEKMPPPPPPPQNKPKGGAQRTPPPLPHIPLHLPIHSPKSPPLPPGLTSSGSIKKKPAPPPPPGAATTQQDTDNPNSAGERSRSSDPPPLPEKKRSPMKGAKLVLPPPPAFRNNGKPEPPHPKPHPAPRNSKALSLDMDGDLENGKSADSISSGDSANGQPVPTPRSRRKSVAKKRRCRALYNCDADNEDELSFQEGEVIVVLRCEEEDWWEGEVEGSPERKGLFPISFVHMLSD